MKAQELRAENARLDAALLAEAESFDPGRLMAGILDYTAIPD